MPVGDGQGTKIVEGKMEAKRRANPDAYPDKGTKRYAQNEKIINNNSALKKARDVAQGLQKSDSAYSDTSAGKGSAQRGNSEEYKNNFDNIVWSRTEEVKPKLRTKVNGKYLDE